MTPEEVGMHAVSLKNGNLTEGFRNHDNDGYNNDIAVQICKISVRGTFSFVRAVD